MLAGDSSTPSNSTRPASGETRPTISRSSVDLPQPLGPSRTVVRPRAGISEVGASASFGPKDLETLSRASIRGAAEGLGARGEGLGHWD